MSRQRRACSTKCPTSCETVGSRSSLSRSCNISPTPCKWACPDRNGAPNLVRKPDLLAFFGRRRLTDTFRDHIRAEFIRLHKRSMPAKKGAKHGQARRSGGTVLKGAGAADHRTPFDHQKAAWQKLERRCARRDQERVARPTDRRRKDLHDGGAWLLKELAKDPELRVLWVADQQELVDEAARSFRAQAPTMSIGITRHLREIHSAADQATALVNSDLDIVCVTRQSLLGRGFDMSAQQRLRAYLQRPCIVIIDEAHHAVAPTYRRMLQFVGTRTPTQ